MLYSFPPGNWGQAVPLVRGEVSTSGENRLEVGGRLIGRCTHSSWLKAEVIYRTFEFIFTLCGRFEFLHCVFHWICSGCSVDFMASITVCISTSLHCHEFVLIMRKNVRFNNLDYLFIDSNLLDNNNKIYSYKQTIIEHDSNLFDTRSGWLASSSSIRRAWLCVKKFFFQQTVGGKDRSETDLIGHTGTHCSASTPLLVNRGLASSPTNNFEPLPGKAAEKYFEVVGTH